MPGGRFVRVEVVANLASGSVGPDAEQDLETVLAEAGIKARICAPPIKDLQSCLKAAVDAQPDLLIVLAGDGTARSAAELCGPDGPLLLILPGGTMNMLPFALVGRRPWQEALTLALEKGEERPLSGGKVEGHHFLVAAILGTPALWAPAREAMRERHLQKAWRNAGLAVRRAFTGRLRYTLRGGPRKKAEALVFMSPLTSRAMEAEDRALEAAAFDVKNATQALRLGFHALVGDWRDDPLVVSEPCRQAQVWSARSIPALLDGEMVRVGPRAEVSYMPNIARVLVLPEEA